MNQNNHTASVFRNIRKQLLIAIIILAIITLSLSTILFIAETRAGTNCFNQWLDALWWVLLSYIDNPGGGKDLNCPESSTGFAVAVLVSIVRILLFAVVTGYFITLIKESLRSVRLRECEKMIIGLFRRRISKYYDYKVVRPYEPIASIQARLGLDKMDIIDAVKASPVLRLRNLADAEMRQNHPHDRLVVERVPVRNMSYGCLVNRDSNVTIVCPTAVREPGIGNFSWYVAQIGRFNYVSREIVREEEQDRSYYIVNDELSDPTPYRKAFMDDLRRLSSDRTHWTIILIASEDPEPMCHFIYGAKQEDTSYTAPNLTVKDKSTLASLLDGIKAALSPLGVTCAWSDRKSGPHYLERLLGQSSEALTIRVSYKAMLWHEYRMKIAETIACEIREYVLHMPPAQKKEWDGEEADGYGYKTEYKHIIG